MRFAAVEFVTQIAPPGPRRMPTGPSPRSFTTSRGAGAASWGIDRNYLYRVLPRLEKEGLLRRRDGGWHVTAR